MALGSIQGPSSRQRLDAVVVLSKKKERSQFECSGEEERGRDAYEVVVWLAERSEDGTGSQRERERREERRRENARREPSPVANCKGRRGAEIRPENRNEGKFCLQAHLEILQERLVVESRQRVEHVEPSLKGKKKRVDNEKGSDLRESALPLPPLEDATQDREKVNSQP